MRRSAEREDNDKALLAGQPAQALLDWYDQHRRALPWRALPGEMVDPYRVWLSEIMLQQTVVKTVIPYFMAFTARWPMISDLAAAPDDEVMAAWAGLGYYSRARKLIACAKEIMARFNGRFPADEASLLALPGIGPYTASALTAIAFGQRAVVVDGNVERVIARLFRIATPLPGAKREIRRHADALTPVARAGDYAQGMMDLGATICTPRRPACGICPLQTLCAGARHGDGARFPIKAPRQAKPRRHGTAFVVIRGGDVLLTRRPPRGLLGGMVAFPCSSWVEDDLGKNSRHDYDQEAPFAGLDWLMMAGEVRHVFTHFSLTLQVMVAQVEGGREAPAGMWWLPAIRLDEAGLPSLMRKVADHPDVSMRLRRQSVMQAL